MNRNADSEQRQVPVPKRWPSIGKVAVVWAGITLLLVAGYVLLLRQVPRDDLEMASTLSFQVVVATISVGVPSLVLLFLFLLIGAIAKRWLVGSNPSIERTCPGKPGHAAHVER